MFGLTHCAIFTPAKLQKEIFYFGGNGSKYYRIF